MNPAIIFLISIAVSVVLAVSFFAGIQGEKENTKSFAIAIFAGFCAVTLVAFLSSIILMIVACLSGELPK